MYHKSLVFRAFRPVGFSSDEVRYSCTELLLIQLPVNAIFGNFLTKPFGLLSPAHSFKNHARKGVIHSLLLSHHQKCWCIR